RAIGADQVGGAGGRGMWPGGAIYAAVIPAERSESRDPYPRSEKTGPVRGARRGWGKTPCTLGEGRGWRALRWRGQEEGGTRGGCRTRGHARVTAASVSDGAEQRALCARYPTAL